jgi:thioredoxin-dependent peroxiredoxin
MTVRYAAPAPDFTLPSTQGPDVTLSSFRGREVVLAFYCYDWGRI